MTEAAVNEGRAAWSRIKDREKATWDDWIAVGRALMIGRAACMSIANVNVPGGGRYNYAMQVWLDENGLAEISAPERYKLAKVMENLDAVEAWRATLDPAERRRLNHRSLWQRFSAESKTTNKPPSRHVRNHAPTPASARPLPGRPVYWQQDHIRRAADAMRESRSHDLFVLARLALEPQFAMRTTSRR
jgi:hypothetical protein